MPVDGKPLKRDDQNSSMAALVGGGESVRASKLRLKPLPESSAPPQRLPEFHAQQSPQLVVQAYAHRGTYILTVLLLAVVACLQHWAVSPQVRAFIQNWEGVPNLPPPFDGLGNNPTVQSIAMYVIRPLILVFVLTRLNRFRHRVRPAAVGSSTFLLASAFLLLIFLFFQLLIQLILPDHRWPHWIGGTIALCIYARVSVMRLAALGMSRWWVLATVAPFLNLWIGYRLFACPSGYASSRKQDGRGVALAVLYWLLVALAVAYLVSWLFMGAGNVGLSEVFGKVSEGGMKGR